MRPTLLKRGDRVVVTLFGGKKAPAEFIRRQSAQRGGAKAVNYFRFPDFVGLNGPEDDGVCQMSDYDVSRKVEALV